MVFSLLENMFAALQKRKPTTGATVLSSLVSCFLLLSFYIQGIVAKLLYSFVKFSVVFSLSNGISSLCSVQNAVVWMEAITSWAGEGGGCSGAGWLVSKC